MDIKINKTGTIALKVLGRTSKGGRSTVTSVLCPEDALEAAKRLKEAAYLSNRLAKINAWPKERREKALADLGF